VMELGPREGYVFRFNAMFDRIGNPARGRAGGMPGEPGKVSLSDGTVLRGKGTQHVPPGERLVLELPGGGGFGAPAKRDRDALRHDLANGYIDEAGLLKHYGLTPEQLNTKATQ